MGFLKNILLDAHAQTLSKAFETIRAEHYSCIVENVANATGIAVSVSKRTLAGDADLSLKALQSIITILFVRQQKYVASEGDANIFVGCLMAHGWKKDRDSVSQHILELKKADTLPAVIAQASLPITHYLLGESREPSQTLFALNATSLTLSAFPSITKYEIASEFRDKRMMEEMQMKFEAISSHVSGGR